MAGPPELNALKLVNTVDLVAAAAAKGGGGGVTIDPIELVLNSSGVVLVVLILLIAFSIACWYIIAYKYFVLSRAGRGTEKFLDAFWGSKRLDAIYQTAQELKASPVAAVFRAGYVELSKIRAGRAQGAPEDSMAEQLGSLENVERALRRAQIAEHGYLERLVPFLATTGSTAPFVGLFGTVWGIMNAFINIGAKGAANLTTVAPGIAEALIATAIGLVAAIPAVMAYNFLGARIKGMVAEMESFQSDFLNIVKRHFLK